MSKPNLQVQLPTKPLPSLKIKSGVLAGKLLRR